VSTKLQDPRKQILYNASKRAKRTKKNKTPNKGQEKNCVDNFRHLGLSEIETPLGYIDLLTDEYLVEFKIYTGAKSALGQVLAYSHFIKPKRKLLIVLFGKGLSSWKAYDVFERVCATLEVEVFKLSHSSKYVDLKNKLGESKL
jgi:hypothetical protein